MLKCPNHELPGNVIIDNFYARLSFQDKTLLDTTCSGSFTRNKEEFKWEFLNRIEENAEGWENNKGEESGYADKPPFKPLPPKEGNEEKEEKKKKKKGTKKKKKKENKKKEVTAYPRVNEITLGNRKYVAPNDYCDNESEYDDLPMPFTYISDHDLNEHTTFDITNLWETNSENDNNCHSVSAIHASSHNDIESSKLGEEVFENPFATGHYVLDTSPSNNNDGLLERDIFDLFLPEFDKPWRPHEGYSRLCGAEDTREKRALRRAGIRRGNSLPEGEIDAIAIVIERDIISIIIIIISTIYTAITTAAPRHRCDNLAFMDTDKFRNMSATYGLDSQVVANLYKAFASHYELPKKNFDKYHEPYKDKVDSSVNKCVVIETDNVIPEAYIEKTPFPAKMKEYSVISSAVNKSEKKPKEPEEQIKIEPAVAIVKDLVTENVEDGHIIFCEDASNIVSHPNKSKQVSVPMLSVRIGDHCYYGLCDIGASVSAIPYELYTEIMHEIGSCELEDIDVVIHLANRETISPIGIVRDVEVLCGKIKYPADFLQHLENSESEAFRKERDELEEIFLRQPILKHDLPVEDLGTTPPPKEDPVFDLKPLPDNLKYAHIDDKKIYPVIISSKLSEIEEERWVSPVHCVPKKGGMTVVPNDNDELIPQRIVVGYRMCIDFQKVNKVTKKDHYPLPFIDQMLERLSKNTHFCFLDGYSRFSQIAVKAKDQEKTTFTCPYGTYAYRQVFMDDFSVYGNSFDNCLRNLDKVLQRCEETNLVLNWEKCHFMVNEGIVLGHKISERGIEVDRAKVEAIEKMPYPRDVKGSASDLDPPCPRRELRRTAFEDVVNPYMNELKMHPKELLLVDGELQIKDVQGPKGEGSLEDRMEKLEQEVFNYKKMAEREVDIFHKIVSELIDGHKKETAKLWDDIFSLHDTTNKLQAQLYDVHNQNCEYENRFKRISHAASFRFPETKMSFVDGGPLPWKSDDDKESPSSPKE
ncbi:hypothetical protein QYE76_015012 [Lolium multiflorum]|uniref:Reverse transcriptase domain-containing protein n=1 Tax=Lolium multiflorum TaxID=4521 RepID=A0AAD8X7C3_LOLMU|nr:hypothetical protein QYE76_015012 [Lolium multiflorum]